MTPAQFRIDETLIRSFQMIDGNLELILNAIGPTSPPDEILEVLKFDMVDHPSKAKMGGINLRLGYTGNVVQYRGNIGFTVLEAHRGHAYAARSCLLLVPLLKKLSLSAVWITCNVDNIPARRSIEKIGAAYIETLEVPQGYEFFDFYPRDSRRKMRFRWDVSPSEQSVDPVYRRW